MQNKFEFISARKTMVSEKEILDDLKVVANKLNEKAITQKKYTEYGRFDCSTVIRKFGTWNKALESAELKLSNELNITDERLFNNILNLWEHLGHQPRRSNLTDEVSEFSQSPYNRRFKSWTNALQCFVLWANEEELIVPDENINTSDNKKKTARAPSLRLRFKVMQRDKFTCQHCGASPTKDSSVELHLDHIVPWSKGGETTYENLQILCLKCNLGKSNLH